MTAQQQAEILLTAWRIQRAAGIPANDRRLPALTSDQAFDRDLEVIRQCMDRKS